MKGRALKHYSEHVRVQNSAVQRCCNLFTFEFPRDHPPPPYNEAQFTKKLTENYNQRPYKSIPTSFLNVSRSHYKHGVVVIVFHYTIASSFSPQSKRNTIVNMPFKNNIVLRVL